MSPPVSSASDAPGAPTLAWHLDRRSGPKRILALDGGGVRGALTLVYLARLEEMLRKRCNRPKLVLSDYFDLIGGTSTGAIIAGGLALGFEVQKLRLLYQDLATRIFRKPFFRIGALVPKFGNKALEQALKDAYGEDTTLASSRLKTGLMLMTKRMDTGKPWPLTNHPDDPYHAPRLDKRRIGNGKMLLWQVVRASTAAPHYFRPEDLVVGSATDPATGRLAVDHGQFIDGGVSTANNPSLQLLKVALLEGFAFKWTAGEDRLLLVSVGTGLARRGRGRARGIHATAGAFAFNALLSVLDDINDEIETMMQWLSDGPTVRKIDGQIGDLHGETLAGRRLLTYRRYNVKLESAWVQSELGLSQSQIDLDRLSQMDRPAIMEGLAALGQVAADRQLIPQHLPTIFDPVFTPKPAPAPVPTSAQNPVP